jgi:hypothetical protein
MNCHPDQRFENPAAGAKLVQGPHARDGGIQAWLSAGQYPNFADALVNLCFAPIVLTKTANSLEPLLRDNDSSAA